MTTQDLKQIQLFRQHLTAPAGKLTVARDLCGIQCQFMTNALHSLQIRCNENVTMENLGQGLVKNWTIRGTVHIFDREDLPLFKYDNGDHMYRQHVWQGKTYGNRNRLTPDREDYFAKYIVNCVEKGVQDREELKTACRDAGMTSTEESFIFDGWGGLLRPLCERGFLNYKVQQQKAFEIGPEFTPMEKEMALLSQMERYLHHIAPATVRDMAYFFGYSQSEVKKLLAQLQVQTFSLNNTDYYYLGELKCDYPDIPGCILLAGFDQLMLGYQKKDSIYLKPEHLRGIFNLTGIVMPALLLGGEVAGRWKRKGKKLEITCFQKISNKEKKQVVDAAEKVWMKEISAIEYN